MPISCSMAPRASEWCPRRRRWSPEKERLWLYTTPQADPKTVVLSERSSTQNSNTIYFCPYATRQIALCS